MTVEPRTLEVVGGVLGRDAWAPGTPYRLNLERFVLTPLTESMVDRTYLDWMRDPDVIRFLDSRYKPQSFVSIRAFVRSFDNVDRFIWRVIAKDGLKPVGNCTLFLDRVNGLAEPGVVIGEKAFWGQNVTFEAYTGLYDFAFGTLGVEKIFSKTRSTNLAAVWNLRKLGMRREGFFPNHVRFDDRRVALIWYGLDRADWRASSTR